MPGCISEASGPEEVRRDSAGVEVVTFRGPDRVLDWRFRRDRALGRRPGEPTWFDRLGRGDVAVDGEGRIYVLSPSHESVLVFDGRSGQQLQSVGRIGEGPGEWLRPVSVALSDDGELFVWDAGRRSLVGPDGRVSLGADGSGQGSEVRSFRAYDDGWLLHAVTTSYARRSREAELVHVAAPDTGVLARLSVPITELRMENCPIRLWLPPVFAPTLRWDAGSGRVRWAQSDRYEIAGWSDGSIRFLLRRPLEPPTPTREVGKRRMGGNLTVAVPGGPPFRCDADAALDARTMASHIPLVGRLRIARYGRLWVERVGDRGTREAIDIWTARGSYLGSLGPEEPFPLDFLPDGRVLVQEEGPKEAYRLVLYRVETAPSEDGR